MFIAFEGVEASGKTFHSGLLCRRIGAESYKTPPFQWRKVRGEIDRLASPQARYQFYLGAMHFASNEIRRILSSGRSVVCDRYFLATLLDHRMLGAGTFLSDFKDIILPDLTVLMTVSPEIQSRRLAKRGMSRRMSVNDNLMTKHCLELQTQYLLVVSGCRLPHLVVSTDVATKESNARQIMEGLHNFFECMSIAG